MAFPPSDRVVFEENTIEEVICQLRFPPILAIVSDVPAAFQERVREKYPLYKQEDPEMWRDFAPYGVAICSEYNRLKEALNSLIDPVNMGLTRYGYKLTDPHNLLQFIFTKGTAFSREQEVRVVMRCYDPVAANNRHIGPTNFPHERPLKVNRLHKWVHDGKRRRINLTPLLTGVVVSPWASSKVCRKVKEWVKLTNVNCEATRSALRSKCLPTLKELAEVMER